MSKGNPSIGTCPCPTVWCKETCAVKKFAHRATTDKGRRNAGKLYIDCPTHGRFGFDGRAGMQEWILEHATIDGQAPRKTKVEPEEDAKRRSAGERSSSAAPERSRAEPEKPASAPASAPRAETSAPERSKKGGGGFSTLLG